MRRITTSDLFAAEVPARYQRCLDFYTRHLQEQQRQEWRFTTARGVTFGVGVLVGILGWNEMFSPWWVVVPVAVFVFVAALHEKFLQQIHEIQLLRGIYQQHLARYERRWADVELVDIEIPAEEKALARDLDLVGRGSVFQWLCVANTPMGRSTLLHWLWQPAESNLIYARQRLVRAIAQEFEWRESLELHGKLLGATPGTTAAFVDWATGTPWLNTRAGLLWISRLSPLALILAVAATAAEWISGMVGATAILGLILFHLVLCVLHTGTIHQIFLSVTGRSNQVQHFRSMLEIALQLPERVGSVEGHDGELRDVARDGVAALSSLDRILGVIHASQAFLFGIPHFVLQIAVLWEFHLLYFLEGWQVRRGRSASTWFNALGQFEALASLATVASEHPEWAYPRVDPGTPSLRAVGIGHPLIPNHKRVVNDVEIGPPGKFLLVTGSNMSGKSTLLRSIGVNALLAQAGSVVCAHELIMGPLDVQTSMRVSDSLVDGVSFFLAELLRMKTIVDHAHASEHQTRRLLYLLDEVLHGTNSRERQIAVARVVRHLIEKGAIGAVTTHDLELASHPDLQPHCQVVHFRETLSWDNGKRVMKFDYQMRPGLSSTSNAITLLEMVGLTDEEKS